LPKKQLLRFIANSNPGCPPAFARKAKGTAHGKAGVNHRSQIALQTPSIPFQAPAETD
jgi:hypothetical protein